MGMFDTLRLDLLGDDEYQTKSLECDLYEYRIGRHGEVTRSRSPVYHETHSEPREQVLQHLGTREIPFYGLINSVWREGIAYIEDDYCIKIVWQNKGDSSRHHTITLAMSSQKTQSRTS